MSNAKKLTHTIVCLIALSVISIPFYAASQATSKVERTAVVKTVKKVVRYASLER